jgi:hypothetical protein
MRVQTSTRHMALFRIFAFEHQGEDDLNILELERAWMRTGLRFADLRTTLREMIEHHLLVVRDAPPLKRLELTPKGQRMARRLPDDVVRWSWDWLTLARIRQRRRGMTRSAGLRQRRKADA